MLDDTPNPSVSAVDVENEHAETIAQKQEELLQQQREKQEESEITRDQLSLSKRLLDWRTLVPLVIVIGLLVYLAQKAHIDPKQTWATVKQANILFFLAAFLVYYTSFPLRALRWHILLENVGFTKENGIHLPKFWKIVEIIYISFFANSLVPAKLGDLYRAYLLRQEIKVSVSRGVGTVLAERLLDLIVLLLLFIPAIIISLHENLPSELRLALEITLGAVVVGIVALFVLRQAREPIAKLVPVRFRGQYYHLQEGMLGSFRRLPLLASLTIGVWFCEALRFFFVAMALSLIPGDLVHILAACIFIGLGEALLTVVPATGGGVGLVEGGMVAMIALFYHGADVANHTVAAIVLDRIISFVSLLVIGFIVFTIAFGRKAVKETRPESEKQSLARK
ncbi:MAG: lysylphosphatidylglycerol synthase transmembrane domain-containing protein [Ktedonobacteraceae bacterium]